MKYRGISMNTWGSFVIMLLLTRINILIYTDEKGDLTIFEILRFLVRTKRGRLIEIIDSVPSVNYLSIECGH